VKKSNDIIARADKLSAQDPNRQSYSHVYLALAVCIVLLVGTGVLYFRQIGATNNALLQRDNSLQQIAQLDKVRQGLLSQLASGRLSASQISSIVADLQVLQAKTARLAKQGKTGPIGPQGLSGLNGSNGKNGAQGLRGPPGRPGKAGVNGTNGTNGAVGPMGPQGPQGGTGPKGDKGDKGDPGQDSECGPNSPNWQDDRANPGKQICERPSPTPSPTP
jgi:hypothetical protein